MYTERRSSTSRIYETATQTDRQTDRHINASFHLRTYNAPKNHAYIYSILSWWHRRRPQHMGRQHTQTDRQTHRRLFSFYIHDAPTKYHVHIQQHNNNQHNFGGGIGDTHATQTRLFPFCEHTTLQPSIIRTHAFRWRWRVLTWISATASSEIPGVTNWRDFRAASICPENTSHLLHRVTKQAHQQ